MLGRLYSRFLTLTCIKLNRKVLPVQTWESSLQTIVIVVGTSHLSESGDPIHSESLEKQLGKLVAGVSKLSVNELFSSHPIGATTVFLNV
jgi:hypothetical protein